ncbi:uncharacterized protein LOC134723790 [Mytilus trossulus]|uniref:uncharacterized protein LOC134723790 n=1 Tax=Mytilus trossulus TaxID=6551 RepID=UPI0030073D09
MIMAYILKSLLFVFICRTTYGGGRGGDPLPVKAAFTATLPGGANHYGLNEKIRYNQMLCTDDGYNYHTGTFTVGTGKAGNYLVSVTMMSGLHVTAHTTLRKNGAIYVWLYTGYHYDMATQTVCMKLADGDKIWVQMNNKASSLFDVYNTFTAVRIN